MRRREFIVLGVLGALTAAGVAINFLIPKPKEVAPQTPTPPVRTEAPPTHTTTPTLTPTPRRELRLEGVVVRNSGDSNPLLGTPWITVGCTGYVGKPLISMDVDVLEIFNTLKDAGLDYGQNVHFTGDEIQPKGSPIKIFIQWQKNGKRIVVDSSEIIFDKTNGLPLSKETDGLWIFLGSAPHGRELECEAHGCIACTVNCNRPLFLANKANSGYIGERSRYYVPEGILPEEGTKVTVIISWK